MRKARPTILCLLMLWISAEAMGSIMIPLSRKNPIKSDNNIRVKIFPHLKNYRPHGKDTQRSSVTLSSEGFCKIYAGSTYRAERTNVVLNKNQKFVTLEASELKKQPLWIQCNKETKVMRQRNRPAFYYSGNFYAKANERDEVELINVIDLEKYFEGVVPSEVYSYWPMETLKTQAVAARTYAVYHLARSRQMGRRFWDVDDSIAYQAYTGLSLSNKRTSASVIATRGQIMTYSGKVIQAYYHANSGGITEQAKNVWMLDVPYVNIVETKGESERKEWSVRLSFKRLERKLRYFIDKKTKNRYMDKNESIIDISVPNNGRTNSDRVLFVNVEVKNLRAATSRIVEVPVEILKRSSQRISSTKFRFEKDPIDKKYINIVGSGDGHGVGMSQNGAMILAKKGQKYDEILNHYYNANICNINRRTKDCYN